MSASAPPANIDDRLRDRILTSPEVILDDRDVMRALVGANDRAMGANIVDMRRLAMERLEARLERLEDTHQTVIATAFDNLSGTRSVHRAVLTLLDAVSFADWLDRLSGAAARTIRVDAVRLVIETGGDVEGARDLMARFPILRFAGPSFCDAHLRARGLRADDLVALQETGATGIGLFGDEAGEIRSEAILRLDLGQGRLPAMLLLGATEAAQFRLGQATDLLAFFGGVVERTLCRWLA